MNKFQPKKAIKPPRSYISNSEIILFLNFIRKVDKELVYIISSTYKHTMMVLTVVKVLT